MIGTPQGCEKVRAMVLHPSGVRRLHDAYRWSALRYDHRLLSIQPSGLLCAQHDQRLLYNAFEVNNRSRVAWQ